jgi:RNA-binding protein YhbY
LLPIPISRSLCELLRAHKLVKVQINGPADAAAAVAASLSADSGGVLLQTKGGTLLFAEGNAEAAALLQV